MSPIIIGVVVLVAIILLAMTIRIVAEYERGVIFRLGRLVGAKGPGLFFIIPFLCPLCSLFFKIIEKLLCDIRLLVFRSEFEELFQIFNRFLDIVLIDVQSSYLVIGIGVVLLEADGLEKSG